MTLSVLEYVMLLRVPLLVAALVMLLPLVAFRWPAARPLLRGLFDVSPLSLVAVTLAASSSAGIAVDNAHLIYRYSCQRVPGLAEPAGFMQAPIWLTLAICLPVIVTALVFSARQNGNIGRLFLAAVPTLALSLFLQKYAGSIVQTDTLTNIATLLFQRAHLMAGYLPTGGPNPLPEHLAAAAGFFLALFIYIGLGIYGYFQLGKRPVVPALSSALLILMLVCSSLSALSFLLDKFHIPVLLVVFIAGFLATWSKQSDHYYSLAPREDLAPAATPAELVNRDTAPRRIILVAANGGGIQAAAWTAQVLQGLGEAIPNFTPSVSLISSVSGGSVGAAYFLYSLEDPNMGRTPADAAGKSSIAEVAWGLAWPDLFRSVLPWFSGNLVGRGRALEKAWCLNATSKIAPQSDLDKPLSRWNRLVKQGAMPALIMNATMAESGKRLLLATTQLNPLTARENARVDAAKLHCIQGVAKDVAVVTAARLSATFPYVTPASRSNADGPQPHIVDGGYYDNYGMSSLVEWLDEALSQTERLESVLVMQLHGAPVGTASGDDSGAYKSKNRGWFYQAYAPIAALLSVRDAGQMAHNNLELRQLQERWFAIRNIPIHTVTFEFPGDEAPLSWHLTAAEYNSITETWNGPKMEPCKQKVAEFLSGHDDINCPCPACQAKQGPNVFKHASVA